MVLVTARPATLAIHPMQLRVGDRLSHADGEGKVVGEPSGLYGGKISGSTRRAAYEEV